MNTERDIPEHAQVVIVGSGFAGMGMGIRLKQEGIEDFVILERGDDVGGTWRDNTYPGCQCDVPSHLYSFSFAPNPTWSRTFGLQPEIQAYLRRTADEYGVRSHCRFGESVEQAAWDEETQTWAITSTGGTITANVFVAAAGGLSTPKVPDVPGLESFEGTVFHSAEWNHEHDLAGDRVAVVGTGASAIQFVPKIQPKVSKLTLFQRTPPWVLPHNDRPITRAERRIYKRLPAAQQAMRAAVYWARETFAIGFTVDHRFMRPTERIAKKHIASAISDPDLRRRLTPDYRIGCKRVLLSNKYYPALAKPNVDVISSGVVEVRGNTVVGADGTEAEVDTIILGTGFTINEQPIAKRVRGVGGQSLADRWTGAMQAYKGTTVAGFPNMFFLVGPNTGLGHTSIVFMIESQINYVIDALKALRRHAAGAVDVKPEAEQAYNDRLQAKLKDTVWSSGGCASWYLDAAGKNRTLWPTFTWPFRETTRHFDASAYEFRAAPSTPGAGRPAASGPGRPAAAVRA